MRGLLVVNQILDRLIVVRHRLGGNVNGWHASPTHRLLDPVIGVVANHPHIVIEPEVTYVVAQQLLSHLH